MRKENATSPKQVGTNSTKDFARKLLESSFFHVFGRSTHLASSEREPVHFTQLGEALTSHTSKIQIGDGAFYSTGKSTIGALS